MYQIRYLAGGEPAEYDTLEQAMSHPGFPDPAAWSGTSRPGRVCTSAGGYWPDADDFTSGAVWVIEAPGVVAELAALAAVARPAATAGGYKVRFLAGGEEPGEYDTLERAMAHAGHPDPGDWCLTNGNPGWIETDWTDLYRAAADGGGLPLDYGDREKDHPYLLRVWVIEAPGVAHELIARLAADDLARRYWSADDGIVKAATWQHLPPAGATASIVAAQLAAHYAVSGELSPALVDAVIADTYLAEGVALPAETVAAVTRRALAAARDAGLTVTDRTGDTGLTAVMALMASTGPGKTAPYRVWHAGNAYHGPGRGVLAGECGSLPEAMAAAGHPGHGDWATLPGVPDLLFFGAAPGRIVTDYTPEWTIEGVDVARAFAESCPFYLAELRRWSDRDEAVIAAVIRETREDGDLWKLPHADACRAGVRLAARYGTSSDPAGSVTTVDVFAVVVNAYSTARMDPFPAGVMETIAIDLVQALRDAGLTVIGSDASDLARSLDGAGGGELWLADRKQPCVACRPHDDGIPPAARPGGLLARLGRHEDRFRAWLGRPAYLARIPGGRLPRWLCATMSNLISHVLIPLGVPFLGVWLTCRPSSWQDLAARGLPLAGWVLAGCVAEKLVHVQIGPPPSARTDRAVRDVTTAVLLAAVSVAAGWPWTTWWAASHLHWVLCAGWGVGAVGIAVTAIWTACRSAAGAEDGAA